MKKRYAYQNAVPPQTFPRTSTTEAQDQIPSLPPSTHHNQNRAYTSPSRHTKKPHPPNSPHPPASLSSYPTHEPTMLSTLNPQTLNSTTQTEPNLTPNLPTTRPQRRDIPQNNARSPQKTNRHNPANNEITQPRQ